MPPLFFRHTALVTLALSATLGCSREAATPVASAAAGLAAVPAPALERFEPLVREQLERQRRHLAELEARHAPRSEVALGFGTLGTVYQAYELYPSAAACYSSAMKLSPGEFRWAYYLGQTQRAQGQLEAAIATLRQAVELDTSAVPARVALGQALQAAGQLDRAREAFEAALDRGPSSVLALFHLGQIASERGEVAEAIQRMEQALALQNDAVAIQRSLAGLYARAGDRARAAELGRRYGTATIVANDPWMSAIADLRSTGRAWIERGTAAFGEERWADAEVSLQRAVALLPLNSEAHLNLGSALFRLGRIDEAEASYRKALDLTPESVLAHFNLGTLLAKRGLRHQANEQYRAALASEPNHLGAAFNLANSLLTLGEFREAEAGFRAVIALDPGHSPARLGRSVTLVRLGRSAEARAVLEEGLAARPEDRLLVLGLTRLLAASPDAAVRDGEQALALARQLTASSNQLEYVVALAMAAAEAGRFSEALTWQRRALEAVAQSSRRDLVAPLERSLALYEAGKPCRTPWTGADFGGFWE